MQIIIFGGIYKAKASKRILRELNIMKGSVIPKGLNKKGKKRSHARNNFCASTIY